MMIGIKDEAPYLAQWLEFHILQGVTKFYVYDNNSKDNCYEVLAPYVKEKIVEIIPVPEPLYNEGCGQWMMVDAIETAADEAEWFLATSIDEYTFCPDGRRLPQFLEEFRGFGGVAVSWMMFNSSGHERRDPGKLVIERFTQTYAEGTPHVKTICKPEFVKAILDPHSYLFNYGLQTVNEYGEVVHGAHPRRVTFDKIRMNHYWTMSREEFEVKMGKGRSDVPGKEGIRRDGADALWDHAHKGICGQNMDAVKFAAAVREAMEDRG